MIEIRTQKIYNYIMPWKDTFNRPIIKPLALIIETNLNIFLCKNEINIYNFKNFDNNVSLISTNINPNSTNYKETNLINLLKNQIILYLDFSDDIDLFNDFIDTLKTNIISSYKDYTDSMQNINALNQILDTGDITGEASKDNYTDDYYDNENNLMETSTGIYLQYNLINSSQILAKYKIKTIVDNYDTIKAKFQLINNSTIKIKFEVK